MKLFIPLEFLGRLEKRRNIYDFKIACYVLNFGRKGEFIEVPFNFIKKFKPSQPPAAIRYNIRRYIKQNRFEDVFDFITWEEKNAGYGVITVLCKKDLFDLTGEYRTIPYHKLKKINSFYRLLLGLSKGKKDMRYILKKLNFQPRDALNFLNYYYFHRR